ncbi:MAG: von Willebrand factor type A domain-containing protein [Rhodothermales bacterium]
MKMLFRPFLSALVVAFLFVGCVDRAEDVEMEEITQTKQEPIPAGGYRFAKPPVPGLEVPPPTDALPPDFNTEDYDLIEENPFQAVTDHPLSTFSIDVDAASYSNLRRFLREGRVPPRDAVRIEELINYFTYDYPDPAADHPFSIITEVGAAPWNAAHQLVHIGLQGKRIPKQDRPASNLVFLLDVSGSMDMPDKLPLLKKAFRMLVGELTERDRVAISVYAGAAGLVLPSTPGDQKDVILESLDRLEAGGSTAGAEGIQLAYQVVQDNFIEGGNNRVILATDGDFNVGISSDGELVRVIEEKREQGAFLTVLGFGTGNLKDSKMEKLADHGNGNYYYIDGALEAKKVLVHELGSTLLTIAKDVKIQVEFNPTVVAAYRLIGYENRLLADEDFADDTKDAGELGAGHTVTALYEVVPVGVESDANVRDRGDLRYQDSQLTDAARRSGEMLTVKLRYKAPDGDTSQLIERPLTMAAPGNEATSSNFYFSAAVAEFGMILRESEHKGEATVEQVLALAKDAQGKDLYGYRAEFIRLVEDYQEIVGDTSPVSDVR